MNFYELQMMCLVCDDLSRYNALVNDIEHINLYLSGFLFHYNLNQAEVDNWVHLNKVQFPILVNDAQHPYFMCGHCMKANLSNLILAERELKNTLYKIFYILSKEDNIAMYHETLRLISGYYPITYKSLERLSVIRERNFRKEDK